MKKFVSIMLATLMSLHLCMLATSTAYADDLDNPECITAEVYMEERDYSIDSYPGGKNDEF